MGDPFETADAGLVDSRAWWKAKAERLEVELVKQSAMIADLRATIAILRDERARTKLEAGWGDRAVDEAKAADGGGSDG